MKQFLVFSIIFFSALFVQKAHAQSESRIILSGYIYEKTEEAADSIRPISYVNVIILRTLSGGVSSSSGYFSIPVIPGDTVLFSSISHKRDTFVVAEDEERSSIFLNVVLQPTNYELKTIEIYGKDFEGFKHDFVNLEVKDTVMIRLDPQWQFQPVKQGFGITINGPLTALWNAFSKQGKELRKLAALIAKERQKEYIDSVYKRPVVLHFLDMEEDEVDGLVRYCNFSEAFVNRKTDYELLLALEQCYQDYIKFKER